MLKDKIAAAYVEVQNDRANAAAWLAEAKEHMKVVDTLCRTQKSLDPNFDKKAFLAELDEPAEETKTNPDEYMEREAATPDQTPENSAD